MESVLEGYGIEKSSVSRQFVAASGNELRTLCERRLEDLNLVVGMIDGIHFGGQVLVVALGASKTPAGWRTVPLTSRLKDELLRWKKLTGTKSSEFVFFHPRNLAKHLLHVPKTWAGALKDANVAARRLYGCRSTFCSRMYAAGVQPVLIERMMGHAGNGVVHSYAKADDDFKRDAAAKLEAFISARISRENTSVNSTGWVN